MKYFKVLFFWVVFLSVTTCVRADPQWVENSEVEKLFNEAGVVGTFVVYDVQKDVLEGYNQSRANQRFVPASTFKIPNSLIGLTVGAVKDVDEVLPYGGKPQPFKIWEEDMGLRKALPISNVPIYQELARRIGIHSMRDKVELLRYGNTTIGDSVDTFWLKGPLEISAVEQVIFLAKLARGRLPFPKETQEAVREITLFDKGEGWELHAKTGLLTSADPVIGWWVGWVVRGQDVYSFALNMDANRKEDVDRRVPLGKAVLTAMDII